MSIRQKIANLFGETKDRDARLGGITSIFAEAMDELLERMPQKPIEPRLCTTCKHHEIQVYGDLCREMIYPITGDYAACYDVRIGSVINYIPVSGKDKACGLDGNLWEPKQQ